MPDVGSLMEAIKNRKLRLAEKDNTIVVHARTTDTRLAYAFLDTADYAIKKLRDGMGYKYSPEEVAEIIGEYNKILKDLMEFTMKVTEKAGTELILPKYVRDILGIDDVETSGNKADNQQP